MKAFLVIVIMFFVSSFYAQESQLDTDEKAVKAVILEVFDAMRASDSIRLKTCFFEEVTVYTSFVTKTGEAKLIKDDIQNFYTSVGTPHPGLYDEKLGDYQIKIDDNLASIWVDYYFYVDENFSHCGVDFFQLYKNEKGWKIFFLSDTRRKKACETPDKSSLW